MPALLVLLSASLRVLPVSDSDGEALTTFTASHRHTLKAFEDGIRGFSPPPRLSSTWSTSTNRVEDFLLVLTPPPCTELVVHPHHGGWLASYVVRGVGNQIRLP